MICILLNDILKLEMRPESGLLGVVIVRFVEERKWNALQLKCKGITKVNKKLQYAAIAVRWPNLFVNEG